ncbi:hypothetical protein ACHAPU_005755 [Fusarium lateritium]
MLFNLSLAVALLAASGRAVAVPASTTNVDHWKGFSQLKTFFVFGDSWSRTGFNPKGTQPNSKNKIGNPAFPGITSSNGPNWVGYLTSAFNESPFLTYNFGTSGAVVDSSDGSANSYTVVREIDEQFAPNYKLGKTFAPDSSLFAIWIGINDVIHNYKNRKSNTYDASFRSYRTQIEKLYKAGARNFLLMTIPPLQLTPRVSKSAKEIPLVTSAVADWNRRVKVLQKQIKTIYPSATVFLYDTYPLFQKVYEKPSQFPETKVYKDTKGFCSKYNYNK